MPSYRHLFAVFFMLTVLNISAGSFAQIEGDFKTPSAKEDENIWGDRRYYVGMTREELFKVFPPDSLQNDFKHGNEEWIVFDDILTTEDLKDIIAFYLKADKIVGWDKKKMPLTPEERLKVIEARHGHAMGGQSPEPSDDGMEYKRTSRRESIESEEATEIPVISSEDDGSSGGWGGGSRR